MCCLTLVSILLISSAVTLVQGQIGNNTTQKIGTIHVDASAVLKELGYTDKNMSAVPEKLMLQILRSYNVQGERKANGDYYFTYTPNSTRSSTNIIGSESVVPYNLSLSGSTTKNASVSPNYMYNQKACLVFAIWDYQGVNAPDLPQLQDSYNVVTNYISTHSSYNYWHFMTNDQCTYYNIWAWITWACATYESVDVIWMGHGVQWTYDAFVTYDGYDDTWGVQPWKCFFSMDMTGYGNGYQYDYSPLRLGIGDFCWGGNFRGDFEFPGTGSASHNRVFIGPNLESNTGYSYDFLTQWTPSYYSDNYNSYSSYCNGYNNAINDVPQGQSAYTYSDVGGDVWCR